MAESAQGGTVGDFMATLNIDSKSVEAIFAVLADIQSKLKASPVEIPVTVSKEEAERALQDTQAAIERTAEAQKTFAEDTQSSSEKTASALGRVKAAMEEVRGVALGLAAAGGLVLAALGIASKNASEDETALRRLELAFGDTAAAAVKFAADLAASTGESEGGINDALATTRKLADTLGLTGQAADDLAFNLVKAGTSASIALGKDLAGTIDTVVQAVARGGPAAKELGVNLSDEAIATAAKNFGLVADKLTDVEKASLRYQLVLKGLTKFQGDAAKGAKTFQQETRALSVQVDELLGDIGKLVNETLKPYVKEITEIVKGIREWIAENPRLSSTLITIAGAISALLIAFATFVTAAGAVIGGVQKIVVALPIMNALFAKGGVAIAGMLSPAAALIIALLAAAAAGAGIGILIDKLFGISAGFAKSAGEAMKLKLATEEAQKLGVKWRDSQAAVEQYNRALAQGKTEVAAQARAIETANFEAKLKKIAISQEELTDATKKYHAALTAGASPVQAFVGALQTQQATLDKNVTATAKLDAAVAKLTKSEEDFKKLAKEIDDAYAQIDVNAGLEKSFSEFAGNLEKLQSRAKEQIEKINALEINLEVNTNGGSLSDGAVKLAQELQSSRLELGRINDLIRKDQQLALADFGTALSRRADLIRSNAQTEIAAFKNRADQIIAQNKRTIDAIDQDLARLTGLQQTAATRLDAILKENRQKELQKENPRLAEIESIKDQATETLKLGGADDKREAVVASVLKQLKEQTEETEEQKRLAEEIAKVQKEIARDRREFDARPAPDRAGADAAVKSFAEQAAEKEKVLAKLQAEAKKEDDRRAQAVAALATAEGALRDASNIGAVANKTSQDEISKLIKERADLTRGIASAEQEVAKAIQSTIDKTEEQIKALGRLDAAAKSLAEAFRRNAAVQSDTFSQKDKDGAARALEAAKAQFAQETKAGAGTTDSTDQFAKTVKDTLAGLQTDLVSARANVVQAERDVLAFGDEMNQAAQKTAGVKDEFVKVGSSVQQLDAAIQAQEQGVAVVEDQVGDFAAFQAQIGATQQQIATSLNAAGTGIAQALQASVPQYQAVAAGVAAVQAELPKITQGAENILDANNKLLSSVSGLAGTLIPTLTKIAGTVDRITAEVNRLTAQAAKTSPSVQAASGIPDPNSP